MFIFGLKKNMINEQLIMGICTPTKNYNKTKKIDIKSS